ncbi:hypothetical protein [Tetragenococcus halophilus]|uniref:hypothetical protein n=1 Tax=Tetragenococcus halophilus TaxID=51669 RepID=UPI00209A807B|nr:hypothetical protein [Tetragenococcus halophilus]MCO8291273.1 hypothetical protein [Tetragenococcus halophilus]
MSKESIEQYLSPAVEGATDKELSIIGVAAFGHNLGLVKTGLPRIYKEFCDTYNVREDAKFDRRMSHYVVTQVEPKQREVTTSTGVVLKKGERPTVKQIVRKAKEFKK